MVQALHHLPEHYFLIITIDVLYLLQLLKELEDAKASATQEMASMKRNVSTSHNIYPVNFLEDLVWHGFDS